MADLKLTDLVPATGLTDDTIFYSVQDGVSKQFSANIIFENLVDPVLKGAIVLDGVQLIRGTDTSLEIDLSKSRTEFDPGPLVIYPNLPNADRDGTVKILTLASVQGGAVEITAANSNIYPNVSITMDRRGDSLIMIYSSNSYSNGWVILGTTPGLKTNLELDEANVTDERIRRALSAGDQTIRYDEANGKIFVGDLSNIITQVSLANVTTDNLREGNVNYYFTNARAISALEPDLNQIRKFNANIIYVAQNGDDLLDGKTPANAVANIHVAISRLQNTFQTVQVFPGDYILHNNPVTIPARCSLIGNDLRTTTVRPENQTSDMFYMNNGCYVFGFTFRDHRAANPAQVKQGAAVFSYNPDGSAGNIDTSPYVQNCSSITTTGTGMRVDGNYVGGNRSMVLDAFTQFNEGGIGVHMLNQGYTQLVSLFTICCEYSVLCEAGGFGSITNSNTSFGKYGLVADGVSPTLYSGTVIRQVDNRTVEMFVTKRPNVNDRILMANYNQAKCFRDTGLIVDAIAFDLAYQGNTQSRFSGLQYWSQGLNQAPDQRNELTAAMEYLKTILTNVVVNSTSWDNAANTPFQGTNAQVILGAATGDPTLIANTMTMFVDIFRNGTFAFTDKLTVPIYPANSSVTAQNTANLLIQNKNFIQSEIDAYYSTNFPYATYIPSKTLFNDVGRIVDSLAFDVLHDSNKQTLSQAALFFDYLTDTSAVQNQRPQTSGAFAFIKTFIDEILRNEVIANTYQTTYVQNTSISANITANEIAYVRARLDDITTLIDQGPYYDNAPYNIGVISRNANTDPNIVAATSIILANRDFIRAEVLEYVNQNWKDLSNGTRNFYTVNDFSNVVANVCTVVFDERILAVDRPLANTRVSFHQGSYLSASSHTFEYVGSGTTLAVAFPFNGGKPDVELEVIESAGGAVYYTSTDHKGDFRIGNELLINRASGTINGRTFFKSLFATMTPYILALQ